MKKPLIMCALILGVFLPFISVKALSIGGQEVEVVTRGNGLYADEYETDKYDYRGANPNNYIWFNDEMWRIVSKEQDGTYKIILNSNIGSIVWGSNEISGGWTSSSLRTYLNEVYLQSITSNADLIVDHDWAVGSIIYNNNNLVTQIENENSTIWNGKIGLISASDYLRANSNIASCGTSYSLSTSCNNTNWLNSLFDVATNSNFVWTINGVGIYKSTSRNYIGNISSTYTSYGYSSYVYPTLYLSSDTFLTGNGTLSDPYVITDPPAEITVNYYIVGNAYGLSYTVPDSETLSSSTSYTASSLTNIESGNQRCDFIGWYTDEDLTEEWVDGTLLSEDLNLYGKWDCYTVVTVPDTALSITIGLTIVSLLLIIISIIVIYRTSISKKPNN